MVLTLQRSHHLRQTLLRLLNPGRRSAIVGIPRGAIQHQVHDRCSQPVLFAKADLAAT